ncbi:hypothetical protein A1351_11955 [Methylosinus sp. R-45379]|uniref:hypothetical protein n=1 Tax=unclassified Methylosinus TaxID=2624500 RepID=UPI000464BFB7|nr:MULTISPECIES: hypothetical protein [unclassified Methylosinus]OAI28413.1 hypothetical protein A1351_11955 [Methylosinus sp. R-45379]
MLGRLLAIFALSCALLMQGAGPSAALMTGDGGVEMSVGCRLASGDDAPAGAHHASHCEHCVICCAAILGVVAAVLTRLAPFPPAAIPAPSADPLASFFLAGHKPPSHAPPRFS